jgi:hypothetical protein
MDAYTRARAIIDTNIALAIMGMKHSLERQHAAYALAQRQAEQDRARIDAEYEQVMAQHRRMNSIEGECTEITDRPALTYEPR